MSYYRLINNKRVEEEQIKSAIQKSSLLFCQGGGHYLAIQDTSAMSYRHHKNRIKAGSLGWIANNEKDLGFFFHPTLVLEAKSESKIGFGHIELWSRAKDALPRYQRGYKQQPIEEKESWRWIESIRKTRQMVPPSAVLTFIQDREGDIFELFEQAQANHNSKIIVRSRDNRRLENEEQKLFEYLYNLPPSACFTLNVRGDIRLNRTTRQACMELRFAPVSLQAPSRLKKAASQKVWAVFAKEKEESVPLGEEPLNWYLLTTHEVKDGQMAEQIVFWYSQRWYIETLFRVLKSKGLGLEQSELEDGAALRRLTLLSLPAALNIMQLWLIQKEAPQHTALPANYDEQQLRCLQQLNEELQGNTEKLSNPNPPNTMTWVAWIIARLGGWNGYSSQRPPGVITMIRGYQRFENIYQGWSLYDVYKP